MAARIGARTAMVGCLGEDLNGDSYIRSLSSDGIDCVNVRRDSRAPTGVAQVGTEADTVFIALLNASKIGLAPGVNAALVQQ